MEPAAPARSAAGPTRWRARFDRCDAGHPPPVPVTADDIVVLAVRVAAP